MTCSAPIFVRARFINANTGEIKEQTVFMGDFPKMPTKGNPGCVSLTSDTACLRWRRAFTSVDPVVARSAV